MTANWLEVSGLIVATVGTLATAAIAIVAVRLSRQGNAFNEARARADDQERRRARRENFAVDMVEWIHSGIRSLEKGGSRKTFHVAFRPAERRLAARAQVIGERRAFDFIMAYREFRIVVCAQGYGRSELAQTFSFALEDRLRAWVDRPKSADTLRDWIGKISAELSEEPKNGARDEPFEEKEARLEKQLSLIESE